MIAGHIPRQFTAGRGFLGVLGVRNVGHLSPSRAGSMAGRHNTYPLPRTAPFSEPLAVTSTTAGAFIEIRATGEICVLRKWGKD